MIMLNSNVPNLIKKRAEAKLGFYIHATVFVIVNIVKLGIHSFTTPDVFWLPLSFLGWGLGLALHYLFAIVIPEWRIREWLIEDEMARLQEMQSTSRER
jgi:2TM domain